MRFLSRRNRTVAASPRASIRAAAAAAHRTPPMYWAEEMEDRRLLSADLTLSISGLPTPNVNAGSNIVYTVSVRNTGNDFGSNVTLTDVIPANTTFVSIRQAGGPGFVINAPPVGGTGTITATVGQLNSSVATTFTITVQVPAGTAVGTVITDTASVTMTEVDPNPFDNTGTVNTLVNTQADIQVDKVNPVGNVVAGTDVTYTVSITNAGPSNAVNAVISDIVPQYATFVSVAQASGPTFIVTSTPPVGQAGTFSATIATLGVGQTASFTYMLHLQSSAPDAATLFNTVTASSDTFDPANSNNFKTVQNTIDTVADILVVSDSDKINNTIEGTYFPYTFTIYNKGPSDAQNATFTWTTPNFPSGLPNEFGVYYRTNNGGPFVLISGPAFAIGSPTIPPVRGNFTGALATLPAGVATTYQFWVGTAENQDLVQNSNGGSATSDPDNTNNSHVDNLHVYDAPLIVQTVPDVQGNAGQASSVEVMTFTDTNAWQGNIMTPNYTVPSGRFFEGPDFVNTSINWGDGAVTTGLISVDLNGTYHVTGYHTYANPGVFGIHTLVTSDGESTAVGDAVAVIGNPVRGVAAVQGVTFNRAVSQTKKLATFFKGSLVGSGVTFTGTINWGDGTATSAATLTAGASGSYNVIGTHTYAAIGNYTATVTVRGSDNISNAVVVPITVIEPSVVATGVDVAAQTGVTKTATVATFTGPVGTFTANVDFGDGTSAAGVVTYNTLTGVYTVTATHTWSPAGTYTLTTTLTSSTGSSPPTTVTSTATVTDVAVTPGVQPGFPIDLSANTGIPLTNVLVATFTDTTVDVVTNYSAVIDWGDLTPNTFGTITYNSTAGRFEVRASHTWSTAGTYVVSVSITHGNSNPVTINSTATVTDLLISSRTGRAITGVEGASLANVVVGSFTTTNPLAQVTQFSATILWGDGTAASPGTIVRTAAGQFQVKGTHTYKNDGNYTLTVTVVPIGQVSTVFSSTAAITDATLTGVSKALNLTKNTTFTGIVASFQDGNPFDNGTTNPPEYTISILWGDGTAASAGTAVYNTSTKKWDIRGTHRYTAVSPTGGFKLNATVRDGTSTVKVTSTVFVK